MTVKLNPSEINVLKYLRCGDGLTFGGKQHLRVGNYILLDTTLARYPRLFPAMRGSAAGTPGIEWEIF